ncbi:hypothetical protein O1L60_33855 [Streptomyces diastatochromogenes]|nr:hypothetical protein [Streptomyces diastatochromogenes]
MLADAAGVVPAGHGGGGLLVEDRDLQDVVAQFEQEPAGAGRVPDRVGDQFADHQLRELDALVVDRSAEHGRGGREEFGGEGARRRDRPAREASP